LLGTPSGSCSFSHIARAPSSWSVTLAFYDCLVGILPRPNQVILGSNTVSGRTLERSLPYTQIQPFNFIAVFPQNPPYRSFWHSLPTGLVLFSSSLFFSPFWPCRQAATVKNGEQGRLLLSCCSRPDFPFPTLFFSRIPTILKDTPLSRSRRP